MKTQIAILLILSCLTFSSCKIDDQDLIVGTWDLYEQYDTNGQKTVEDGKWLVSNNGSQYTTMSILFEQCANSTDSCDGGVTLTTYYADKAPNTVSGPQKYLFINNTTLVFGNTKYKIAKLTKSRLEMYPTTQQNALRIYNKK